MGSPSSGLPVEGIRLPGEDSSPGVRAHQSVVDITSRSRKTARWDRRNGLPGRTKKPIKKARKIAALKPLDNIDPIQGTSGSNREAESTDAPARGGLLGSSSPPALPTHSEMKRSSQWSTPGEACFFVVMKRGNARGAKGAGYRHWRGSTGNGGNPNSNGRR